MNRTATWSLHDRVARPIAVTTSAFFWLMGPSGTPVSLPTLTQIIGNDWQVQGTGDFNGRGKTDILWRNDSGTVGVWLMGPSGTPVSLLTLTQIIGNDRQVQG
jgi:hypothetical protein